MGRREDRLETTAKRYGPHATGEIIPLQGDVTSKEDLARLASELEAKEGSLHILVNNAGIAGTNQGPQARNVTGGAESKVCVCRSLPASIKERIAKPCADK